MFGSGRRLACSSLLGSFSFDAHPPFQIDGNFGYTAGVAEMLLQSQESNVIRLLPALPNAWESGYVKGLKARGGYTVDIFWNNGKLINAAITSKYKSDFKLKYMNKTISVKIKEGETFFYFPN